jgi:membrane-associated protein
MYNDINPATLGFFEKILYQNSGSFIAYIILFLIIFAESGLLIGFFLPGDTLLVGAGILSAGGILNIWTVVLFCLVGAVLGDWVGYYIGMHSGPRLFKKPDGVFFHKDHLIKAEKFYEKHGKKTIIIARFIPIVRTFAPVVAGIGKMNFRDFIFYNFIGGFLWAGILPFAGYFLTKSFPSLHIEKYIEPVIWVVVISSVVPAIYHLMKANLKKRIAV